MTPAYECTYTFSVDRRQHTHTEALAAAFIDTIYRERHVMTMNTE